MRSGAERSATLLMPQSVASPSAAALATNSILVHGENQQGTREVLLGAPSLSRCREAAV